jgi:hypothetical protein
MKDNTLDSVEIGNVFITPASLLEHWQGHRRITRRVIEAFPEDKLFNYSIGGMRPFAALVLEMIGMAVPGVKGVASGTWEAFADAQAPSTKQELLEEWDKSTRGPRQTLDSNSASPVSGSRRGIRPVRGPQLSDDPLFRRQ